MRTFFAILLCVGSTLLFSFTGCSENKVADPNSEYPPMGNPYKLVQITEIQNELNLGTQQRVAITKMVKEREADRARTMSKQYSSRDEERAAYTELDWRTQNGITNILAPSQTERLREISIQTAGPASLLSQETRVSLQLTDKQQKEMRDILDHMNADQRSLSFLGRREELEAKAKEILTAKQYAEYEEMKGAKVGFDVERLFDSQH